VPLFVRNRSGAHLTQQGRRFLKHAKSMLLTLEQAKHDIGLPSRFRASITVGARIALWETMLPRWIGEIRNSLPDVSLRCEIGFEEDLMRRLIEGTVDIGMMYAPQHSPGLKVEHLFDETLVLLTTRPNGPWPGDDYIYVDWGPEFYAQHSGFYPDMERPAQVVNIGWLGIQLILSNGGSCFLPIRMAESFIWARRLHRVPGSPEFKLPSYMVYPLDTDSAVLTQVLGNLRKLAAVERQTRYS
jgi:DNA-binding transcriptional LysR family regulator